MEIKLLLREKDRQIIAKNFRTGTLLANGGAPRGQSAYEQAVEGGYTGTKEEFEQALAADISTIASGIEDISAVSENISDVITVSENISDVQNVSDNISDVNTVGSNMSDVNTVAGISTDVTSVAGISSAVSTVAAHDSDVTLVSDNMASVMTTATSITDVQTVAGIASDVSAVASIASDVSAVEDIKTDVSAVASNATNINAVADNATNINAVAANESNINAVNANKTNIDAVAGNNSNITAVANNESNINAVNSNKTNIDAVAGNSTNINAVAGNESNINAVNANKTNIDTVAGNNTNITTVATNISNVNTAVTNMAAIIAAPTAAANAATSEANAQTWAEGSDSAVAALGGTKSSKGWADRAQEIVDSIGTVLHYKGSVATYSDLPSSGNVIGDVWNVLDDGSNYAWDGTGWDKLSGTIDLSAYRTAAAQDLIDAGKQATLVSGTNIKTINSTSLLGSGNISVWDNTNLVGSDTILISQAPGPIIDANTLAVWHFDDGLTDVVSGLTIGGKQTADYHKFGPGAGYEVGLYDSGFSEWRTSVSELDCTSDDFTVDGWVYYNGNGGQRVYFGPGEKMGYYFNGTGIGLYGSDDVVRAYVNKTSSDFYGNADYQLTSYGWHHLAIQQDVTAQKIQFFCDGNMFYEYSGLCNSYDFGVANKAVNAVANPESVWYDEVRVSNVVRYPSTGFTPFTEAYGNGSAPYEIKAANTLATTAQLATKQNTLVSGTNIKTINGNSILGSGNLDIDALPSQTGQSGKFLTTDGTDASWANVDALPSQTGQSGKFLTTDGSSASWSNSFNGTFTGNLTGNATTATKATADANGDTISTTYAKTSLLATVATSGSYTDLINTPTIPAVNNATLTIQKNGTDVATFTANSSTNVTANIDIPTDLSNLTNNDGFIKNDDVLYDYNPFVTSTPRKIYQGKLDNTLYEADKRFTVTLTNFKSGSDNPSFLFDGNAETQVSIEKGVSNAKILIDGTFNLGMDYPYGYLYLGFYYICAPTSLSSVSCRVYQNWDGYNVGWVDLSAEEVCKTGQAITIMRFGSTNGIYGIEKIEITIDNTNGSPYSSVNYEVWPSDISFFCNRTGIHSLPVMTKWGSDTKYGDLTIPTNLGRFNGNLNGTADKATKDGAGNNIVNTYVNKSGDTMTGNLFVPNLYPTAYCYLGQDSYLVFKEKGSSGSDAWIEQQSHTLVVNRAGYDQSCILETKDKAVANGVASLDTNAKVPLSQLPDIAVSSDNKSITKNSNNELQAVGLINQNNTANATKEWIGTKAQYDAITTKDPNTRYITTDEEEDSNPSYPRIVETYSNGTSGYRVWSDGYCEQWGTVSTPSGGDYQVTLLKEMANSTYQVRFTGNSQRTAIWMYSDAATTTTSFYLCTAEGSGGYVYWEVKGYIA